MIRFSIDVLVSKMNPAPLSVRGLAGAEDENQDRNDRQSPSFVQGCLSSFELESGRESVSQKGKISRLWLSLLVVFFFPKDT
jgi:hypothetical protein